MGPNTPTMPEKVNVSEYFISLVSILCDILHFVIYWKACLLFRLRLMHCNCVLALHTLGRICDILDYTFFWCMDLLVGDGISLMSRRGFSRSDWQRTGIHTRTIPWLLHGIPTDIYQKGIFVLPILILEHQL